MIALLTMINFYQGLIMVMIIPMIMATMMIIIIIMTWAEGQRVLWEQRLEVIKY